MPLKPSINALKKSLPAMLIPFCLPVVLAAQTVVKGRVTDSETFEPVVFANVIFKGTSIGAKTDFDGRFNISTSSSGDSIVVSFIGYDNKTIGIKPGIQQELDIQLHPALYSLNEVLVRPGENPAHVLLRKVWKNSEVNNTEKLASYNYTNYSRSTVYIRKFGDKSDDERRLRIFASEYDKYSISTGEEGIPALPSFMTETVSDHYFLKNPERKYNYIRATTSDGIAFENSDLVAQLVNRQEDFYFPKNTVKIIDKSFISPLSRFGIAWYNYTIADTVLIDNKYYCFEIRFTPRRQEDPVFHGSFWINDTTYALKRISVEVSGKAELNFIQRIKIQQDYLPESGGAWFAVRTRFMADAINIFITNYSEKTDIRSDRPPDPVFFGSELKIDPGARNDDPGYWMNMRSGSLDHIDSLASRNIKALKQQPKIRVSAKLVESSVKGYYNFGSFEAGPWIMLYRNNPVEGHRFRAGGRTNSKFSSNVFVEGYLAYGTADKKLKGSLQGELILSKERWTRAGLQYRDDVENTGAADGFFSGNSFLTVASSFGGSEVLNRSVVMRGWLETDIFKGLTGKLVFTRRLFEPAGDSIQASWFTDPSKTTISDSFTTSEVGLLLRYQPKAVYVTDGIRRFPVNFNNSPEFTLQYFRGYEGIFGGDYDYEKFSASLSQAFNAGGMGRMEYELKFTKVYGQLPYPLLVTLAGNSSVFWSSRTYNLMRPGEFVADEALELYGSYHMNGLLLNRIPLIKKLQWRSVISAHAAFGALSDKNNFYDPINNHDGILSREGGAVTASQFKTLSYDKPYVEISYGIENIFRILRVDLVQRLTWLDQTTVKPLGVRISGVFRF